MRLLANPLSGIMRFEFGTTAVVFISLLPYFPGCSSVKKSKEEINRKSSELNRSFKAANKNDDTLIDLADWLKLMQDFRVVDIPILPGSHNSASAEPREKMEGPMFKQFARQQEISIRDQLLSGARVLDFRLRFEGGLADKARGALELDEDAHSRIRISHGFDTSYRLEDALAEVMAFLYSHPTEFVVILLKGDWEPKKKFASDENKAQRVSEVANVLKTSGLGFVHPEEARNDDIKVSDVKGRVFLVSDWLQDDPTDDKNDLLQSNGIAYFSRSKYYKVCDIWNTKSKDAALTRIDNFMIMSRRTDENDRSLFALPGAALFVGVALDRTEPCGRPKKWADWFASNLETNSKWRSASSDKPVIGVVLTDFTNPALIKRLLDVGFSMAGLTKVKTKFSLDWFKQLELKCSFPSHD